MNKRSEIILIILGILGFCIAVICSDIAYTSSLRNIAWQFQFLGFTIIFLYYCIIRLFVKYQKWVVVIILTELAIFGFGIYYMNFKYVPNQNEFILQVITFILHIYRVTAVFTVFSAIEISDHINWGDWAAKALWLLLFLQECGWMIQFLYMKICYYIPESDIHNTESHAQRIFHSYFIHYIVTILILFTALFVCFRLLSWLYRRQIKNKILEKMKYESLYIGCWLPRSFITFIVSLFLPGGAFTFIYKGERYFFSSKSKIFEKESIDINKLSSYSKLVLFELKLIKESQAAYLDNLLGSPFKTASLHNNCVAVLLKFLFWQIKNRLTYSYSKL